MLNYKRDRLDYGERLIPPEGYELTRAVAATYSLDLDTLLSVPVALFFSQTLEGLVGGERVQLLDAIRRSADVVRVYHQEGRIQVPRRQNKLYGLLEDCVVGVLPDGPFASFHPKVWLLRFEREDAPVRYRLLVLSRNLTADRSWDLAATLEGEVGDELRSENAPLLAFVRHLTERQSFERADQFLTDLSHVRFAVPRGFYDARFHPIGVDGSRNPIERQGGERVLCVSPFVHPDALDRLAQNVSGERWLLGRAEELVRMPAATLEAFSTFALSNFVVDGESLGNADDGGAEPAEQNLHAKLFVYQTGKRSHRWYLGSANATRAALERNVEFLLELRSSHESVSLDRLLDDLLGPEPNRDAGVFEPYAPPDEPPPEDAATTAFEQAVRRLEFGLLRDLKARGMFARSANRLNFDLHLAFAGAERVNRGELDVHVGAFNSGLPTQPLPREDGAGLRFENVAEANLSRFLEFQIRGGEGRRAFLAKMSEVIGMPEGRVGAIVRGVVADADGFLEYLRFLLAEEFEKPPADDRRRGGGADSADAGGWDRQAPILERLLVTASRRPGRLREIDRLIKELRDAPESERVVPEEFLTFWRSFRAVATPEEVDE